jgi:outer membrane protein assembly factor BamE (lipoprotein component of BamABCDE complex)
MRQFVPVVAVLLLAGCTPHVPQPLLTHTAQPVCADTGPKAASLYRGMSPQDVRQVLGEPLRTEAFRYGDLPAETWYYSTDPMNDYVELANGKLSSWRLQRCTELGG